MVFSLDGLLDHKLLRLTGQALFKLVHLLSIQAPSPGDLRRVLRRVCLASPRFPPPLAFSCTALSKGVWVGRGCGFLKRDYLNTQLDRRKWGTCARCGKELSCPPASLLSASCPSAPASPSACRPATLDYTYRKLGMLLPWLMCSFVIQEQIRGWGTCCTAFWSQRFGSSAGRSPARCWRVFLGDR